MKGFFKGYTFRGVALAGLLLSQVQGVYATSDFIVEQMLKAQNIGDICNKGKGFRAGSGILGNFTEFAAVGIIACQTGKDEKGNYTYRTSDFKESTFFKNAMKKLNNIEDPGVLKEIAIQHIRDGKRVLARLACQIGAFAFTVATEGAAAPLSVICSALPGGSKSDEEGRKEMAKDLGKDLEQAMIEKRKEQLAKQAEEAAKKAAEAEAAKTAKTAVK